MMAKSQILLKSRILLLLLFTLVPSACTQAGAEFADREGASLGTTKDEIQRSLDEKLQKGATPNEVLAVLNQAKVDHSDYLNPSLVDPGLVAQLDRANAAGPTYINSRRIEVIMRDVKKNGLVSESIQIIFVFDERDKLAKYETRTILTVP